MKIYLTGMRSRPLRSAMVTSRSLENQSASRPGDSGVSLLNFACICDVWVILQPSSAPSIAIAFENYMYLDLTT
jgi:hypothetical protein